MSRLERVPFRQIPQIESTARHVKESVLLTISDGLFRKGVGVPDTNRCSVSDKYADVRIIGFNRQST